MKEGTGFFILSFFGLKLITFFSFKISKTTKFKLNFEFTSALSPTLENDDDLKVYDVPIFEFTDFIQNSMNYHLPYPSFNSMHKIIIFKSLAKDFLLNSQLIDSYLFTIFKSS